MRKVLLAPVAVVLATSAACGGTPKKVDKPADTSIERSKVEEAVAARLADMEGEPAKSVACPQALRPMAKAATQCTLTTHDGATLPVTATVTSISAGNTVNLDVVSPWLSKSLLASLLSKEISSQISQEPVAVTCPGDLKSQPKATIRCTVTEASGTSLSVAASVTSVDNSRTEFDWSVKQ